MITKEDVRKKLREIIETVKPEKEADLLGVLHLYLQYIQEHYYELEEEVRKAIDKTIDESLPQVKKMIDKLPEGRQRRELRRMWKGASGRHFYSESLVKILERSTSIEIDVLKDMRKIFIRRLQNILDFLSDALDTTKQGRAEFAKIGLFYLCVDELLAAFHLAQHSFINQSYSHIRSVFEALDKIELFDRQPEWAELWSSLDPKEEGKRLRELKPSSVRKKLGKGGHDPLYSFFSELGPHGTFRGVQSRSAISEEVVDGKPQIQISVGGLPFDHNIIWVSCYLLEALGMMLLMIIRVYGHLLDQDEVLEVRKGILAEWKLFNEKHFIPWARKVGLDVSPLVRHLETLPEIDRPEPSKT